VDQNNENFTERKFACANATKAFDNALAARLSSRRGGGRHECFD